MIMDKLEISTEVIDGERRVRVKLEKSGINTSVTMGDEEYPPIEQIARIEFLLRKVMHKLVSNSEMCWDEYMAYNQGALEGALSRVSFSKVNKREER